MAKAMHRCTTGLQMRFNEDKAAGDAVEEVDGWLLWSDVELLGPEGIRRSLLCGQAAS